MSTGVNKNISKKEEESGISTSENKEDATLSSDLHKDLFDEESKVNSKHKSAKRTNTVAASIFTGLFWIITGTAILIYNFLPSDFAKLFFLWGVFILGIYLVVFSLLACMRRIYFIFGILLLALGLGQTILYMTDDSSSQIKKIIWPIIMLVISISVIVYGMLFRRDSKKFTSYIVVGIALICFSSLVFLSIFDLFSLSFVLQKIWPVFLILLGVLYIQRRTIRAKKAQEELEHKQDVPKKS